VLASENSADEGVAIEVGVATTGVLEGGQDEGDQIVVDVAGKSGMSPQSLQRHAPRSGRAIFIVERAVLGGTDLVSAPEAVDARGNLGHRFHPLSDLNTRHRCLGKRVEALEIAET
jgi:hypothetical protein